MPDVVQSRKQVENKPPGGTGTVGGSGGSSESPAIPGMFGVILIIIFKWLPVLSLMSIERLRPFCRGTTEFTSACG